MTSRFLHLAYQLFSHVQINILRLKIALNFPFNLILGFLKFYLPSCFHSKNIPSPITKGIDSICQHKLHVVFFPFRRLSYNSSPSTTLKNLCFLHYYFSTLPLITFSFPGHFLNGGILHAIKHL